MCDPTCVVEKPQSRGDIPDQACGLAFTVRPLLTHAIKELSPGAQFRHEMHLVRLLVDDGGDIFDKVRVPPRRLHTMQRTRFSQ